jgi:steroid 5-alpha reductase family enzyme|tara:strand:+ start:1845 stop:2717 length:873 start_codon:yes stop_codon:yes gene_type:complete
MKHLTNLTIAAGVFIFTKLYADAISFNSIDISGVNLVGHLLVMIFVIQWIAYIPAFIFKTEKFYDLTGSLTYISAILLALYSTNTSQSFDLGGLIIGLAIIVWAIRLGSFLFMRIHKDKKDGRFDSIKTSFSQFFMTWTLQGMWVFICSSAALVAIANPTGVVINSVFMLGLALFILGFVVEVIADNQKTVFRSIPENKDLFINEGLWARSRHPNYFGEITLWTGITVMGISTFEGMNYLAIFSPIFSYLLLVYVSGVRMLEYRGHKKWGHLEEYQNYKKNTPKLIPKLY